MILEGNILKYALNYSLEYKHTHRPDDIKFWKWKGDFLNLKDAKSRLDFCEKKFKKNFEFRVIKIR